MPLNVLIVDDSDVIRTMIARTLDLAAIPVGELFEAANGREALSVLEESWVDLVLADINMPIMNGIEMLERLRNQPETADLPVIIVSTEGANSRLSELREKGVSAWIRKPFTPEEIRDVVNEVSAGLSACSAKAELVDEVLCEVLERFAFVFAETATAEQVPRPVGELAAARVTFSGAARGAMSLAAPMSLARDMAANVLGVDSGEATAESRGPDTLGEILNMTCGHLATAIDADDTTELEPPTVSRISVAEWSTLGADPTARFFMVEGQPVVLTVYVRALGN